MEEKLTYDGLLDSTPAINSVKKYYFLDYIYILLDSVNAKSKIEETFYLFLRQKKRYRLGESKYKKLTVDSERITNNRITRYIYTFDQVREEAALYGLITFDESSETINITELGKRLLQQRKRKGPIAFNEALLKLMEPKYGAFKYILNRLYKPNRNLPGFLFLPSYSPLQLGIDRDLMKTTGDFLSYSKRLALKLEQDINDCIGVEKHLSYENEKLIKTLIKTRLLPPNDKEPFETKKYNAITKRFREYWMTYFLRNIYNYQYSMNSFDLWTYRGKQIGIIHATEFHPFFHGKIVYPLSVIAKTAKSRDFAKLYTYPDGNCLFVHKPLWSGANREKFISTVWNAYYNMRREYHSYFVNLMSLREIVCLNMKISQNTFDSFMNETYQLNLLGKLPIRISLEVDKLPEETGAMYLKREPVMIDKKYRNIIAIDATKEPKHDE
jgi:hypothetical protein